MRGWNGAAPRPVGKPRPWVPALAPSDSLAGEGVRQLGPWGIHAARAAPFQFDTFLRPGEVLGLTRAHIIPARAPGAPWSVVVAPPDASAEGSAVDLAAAAASRARAQGNKARVFSMVWHGMVCMYVGR